MYGFQHSVGARMSELLQCSPCSLLLTRDRIINTENIYVPLFQRDSLSLPSQSDRASHAYKYQLTAPSTQMMQAIIS